jgi:uncharacterized protein with HEPN domain
MKDKIYIDRIIKYAKKICRYTEEVDTFTDFENNDEKVDAVILNLEQIGETARNFQMRQNKFIILFIGQALLV